MGLSEAMAPSIACMSRVLINVFRLGGGVPRRMAARCLGCLCAGAMARLARPNLMP